MNGKSGRILALTLTLALTLCSLWACAAHSEGNPIAENLELKTYRGVSVGGQLKGTDPNGDMLKFEITTKPIKGAVALKDDGSFVYTPGEGKRGHDYFGYKAVDSKGNKSSEATVVIKIEKQKSKITYSDMQGNGSYMAAVRLAEENIFTGEQLGGQYVFCPDRTVSRGEFLTMCMKLAGSDILTGVMTTGFADDADIPAYMKPYVSTALLSGVIHGYSGSGGAAAAFAPEAAVTYPEAAVMLDRALGLTKASTDEEDKAAPAWAVQACADLSACRIGEYTESGAMTRAQCAEMLCNAMQVLEKR